MWFGDNEAELPAPDVIRASNPNLQLYGLNEKKNSVPIN